MRIERFEDIETWQLARELTHKVYGLTKKAKVCSRLRLEGINSVRTFTLLGDSDRAHYHSRFHQVPAGLRARSKKER